MGADNGDVALLRMRIVDGSVLLDVQREDVFLRVGRCAGVFAHMSAIEDMLLDMKRKRHGCVCVWL